MINFKKFIILKTLITIPCAFLIIIFVIPMSEGIVNIGNISGFLFCIAVIIGLDVFLLTRHKKGFLKVFIALGVAIALGLVYVGILSINMIIAASGKLENVPPAVTVIVLGCHVDGEYPSIMLARRLSAAHEYLLEDLNAVCVVTGGQGPNEIRTEAGAMSEWLVNRDIKEERVYIEDESTSTIENLQFAYNVIIKNNLPLDVIIVSDGFHLWRAKMIGKRLFDSVQTLPAHTQTYLLPTYWVREWFSITVYFIR